MADDIIKFLREKDLIHIKDLGSGACGRTVLLYDDVIDENFVCKKYSPANKALKKKLFDNFIQEIKILHLLHHRNVVRVFNYYIYLSKYSGYILMELVEGADIEDYLTQYPENANEVFVQLIEGFTYLESHSILHRDIRPQNILVSDSGVVKIIDFGFGKQILTHADFEKSISLNWWCEPPLEFSDHIYDYTTEVYFVGKLMQKIIREKLIEQFKYEGLLGRMCASNPLDRIKSFSLIKKELLSEKFSDMGFTEQEISDYRNFSDTLYQIISKIEKGTKYEDDVEEVQLSLENLYKIVMLEKYVPKNTSIIRCFVNGAYYFTRHTTVSVSAIKIFAELLRSCSREKKNIILSNIQSRLDSIERYSEESDFDDVPF